MLMKAWLVYVLPVSKLSQGHKLILQVSNQTKASKQAEMSKAKLQQLSPVQQRKAAAILGALVADSASKEAPSHHYVHTPVITGYIFTPPPGPPHYYLTPPAASPLHWIYDQEEVKRITSTGTIAFVPEPHCPYYHIPTGTNSAYGAQVFVTLREVATNKGDLSIVQLAGIQFQWFSLLMFYCKPVICFLVCLR